MNLNTVKEVSDGVSYRRMSVIMIAKQLEQAVADKDRIIAELREALDQATRWREDEAHLWATGICSRHQRPDPNCRTCNLKENLPALIDEHKALAKAEEREQIDKDTASPR